MYLTKGEENFNLDAKRHLKFPRNSQETSFKGVRKHEIPIKFS